MLLHHLMDHQLTWEHQCTSLLRVSLTTVLGNHTKLPDSQFIKIMGNNNLLKATQQLRCKKLRLEVSLTININNNLSNIDYFQVNTQIIINFFFFDLTL